MNVSSEGQRGARKIATPAVSRRPDVLFIDTCGPAFTSESVRKESLGGSELEITQIAEALAKRGYSVVVANNLHPATKPSMSEGVTYISAGSPLGPYLPRQAMYIERTSQVNLPDKKHWPPRIVVRATDFCWEKYGTWRPLFEEQENSRLVVVSKAQAETFSNLLGAERTIMIPPMLGDVPKEAHVPGRFVFASAPCKGLESTLNTWMSLVKDLPKGHRPLELHLVLPGYHTGEAVTLTPEHKAAGIRYSLPKSSEDYRKKIAEAEAIFMVSEMTETFGCCAAFAQRAGTRIHMLCVNGEGGVPEALGGKDPGVTTDRKEFRDYFLASVASPDTVRDTLFTPPDCSIEALASRWEETLGLSLDRRVLPAAAEEEPLALSHGEDSVGPTKTVSVESTFATEALPKNETPFTPYFGELYTELKRTIAAGGSEFGVYTTLFALAVATRSANIVEIGRFRGGATLALASALRLIDEGWQEPKAAEQRPDVDYTKFLGPRKLQLTSIDPFPLADAEQRIARNGLSQYVTFVNEASQDAAVPSDPIDLLFIDGDHSYDGVVRDIRKFVPRVKMGGYFVLHDIYGWYSPDGKNGSPISKAILDCLEGFESVLLDTGFVSAKIFRKSKELDAPVTKAKPRADGRPTIGLVMIARKEGPVLARALVAARKLDLDATTVVIDDGGDASDAAVEIARQLGAEVHVRPTPPVDWEKGDGFIARARNEALAIAEQKTEYLLMLDPDDIYEGTLPQRLEADAYKVRIKDGSTEYTRAQLFRGGKGFRYAGIRHEVLQHPSGTTVGAQPVPGLTYRRVGGGGSFQDQDEPQVKFLKHAKDLEKWLIDHPNDDRAAFYVAQSFRDSCRCPAVDVCKCGGIAKAMTWYERRIELGGWDEERWFSALQIAVLSTREKKEPIVPFLRAYAIRPTRAESLFLLAVWLRDEKVKRYAEAYIFARQCAEISRPNDELFLDSDLYAWKGMAERGICGYWAGEKEDSIQAFLAIQDKIPPGQKAWAADMLAVCRRGKV